MRIAAATASGPAGRLVVGRDLSVAGVGFATARMSAEQVTCQLVTQAGHALAVLMERIPTGRLPLVDLMIAWVAGLRGVVDVLPGGPVTVLVTLLLPVGGPVWAGILPLGTTVRGARGLAGLLSRASRTLPASRNVLPMVACQAGAVSISVVIVDDSAPFRDVARQLLERGGLTVVGVAASAAEAVAQVDALDPDVVLVDIYLGADSGFDVARQLVPGATGQRRAVVLMSTHAEAEFVDLIEASPAAGFVPKEQLSAEAVLEQVAGAPSA